MILADQSECGNTHTSGDGIDHQCALAFMHAQPPHECLCGRSWWPFNGDEIRRVRSDGTRYYAAFGEGTVIR